jgi:DNA-binding GntR family transcriptional regulator
VFEMRRLIEPGAVRRLISTMTPDKLERLREHHARELDARRRNDTRSVIRLSGEFHMLLADLAGNSAVVRSMRELSTLTCLIISLYDAPTSDACRADEHALLIDAIEDGDVGLAEKLMLAHLDHIESSLNLNPVGEDVDLEAVFSKV